MTIKVRYPKTVPILTAGDICRNRLDSADGSQHCLVGWVREVFTDDDRVWQILMPALWRSCRGVFPVTFNNDYRNSTKKIANTWNRFVASLGYTEIIEVK